MTSQSAAVGPVSFRAFSALVHAARSRVSRTYLTHAELSLLFSAA